MAVINETQNFLMEYDGDIANLQNKYPGIRFYPLTYRKATLSVPPSAQQELEGLRLDVGIVFPPYLYGLNIETALQNSNISQFHTYPFGELRGNGVLVGFVDTGIDYTNTLFQYEDNTTRIVTLWDQTIEGNPPALYKYGTEYTREQINEALKAEDPYRVVPSRDEIGHGTFLAGVTAGYDRGEEKTYTGGAPDAQLVVVKLKQAPQFLRDYYLIQEGPPAYEDTAFLEGINYLVNMARQLGKPMAICVGVGTNDGSHDGETISERFLAEVSTFEGIVLSIASGNEANLGHHYSGVIATGEEKTFELNISEEERGLIMQLWVTSPDKIAIGVTSPLGNTTQKIPLTLKDIQINMFPLEKSLLTITYEISKYSAGDEEIRIRMEAPTPGIWNVTVYGEFVVNGTYNAWVPREGFITPSTRFLKADPFVTVCTPATARECMIVGAYNDEDGSIYAASGRGPTRSQVIKPDFIAPGVNIMGPTPGGGYTVQTGTSIAAAVTTSASALLLEWAIINGNLSTLTTRVAKSLFIRGAKRSSDTTYPNPVEGYGKLDLRNTFFLI